MIWIRLSKANGVPKNLFFEHELRIPYGTGFRDRRNTELGNHGVNVNEWPVRDQSFFALRM